MSELRKILAEKIQFLSEDTLSEAIIFIDFLTWKKKSEKTKYLLSLSGSLSGCPVSSKEIDEECLYEK